MRTAAEVQSAIDSYEGDPADSPFQRGYLAALKWAAGQDEARPLDHGEAAAMLTQRAMRKAN